MGKSLFSDLDSVQFFAQLAVLALVATAGVVLVAIYLISRRRRREKVSGCRERRQQLLVIQAVQWQIGQGFCQFCLASPEVLALALVDKSTTLGLPAGTFTHCITYCQNKPECVKKAQETQERGDKFLISRREMLT